VIDQPLPDGPPESREEHLAQLAKAWDEGYDAGQQDAFDLEQAKAAGPSTAENLLAEGGTPNPYAPADQPVDTTEFDVPPLEGCCLDDENRLRHDPESCVRARNAAAMTPPSTDGNPDLWRTL
jgi:hypothetical protein